jgi:hypothetical protein
MTNIENLAAEVLETVYVHDERSTDLFVCFNDSDSDPTYASAYDAHFVIGYSDGDENPCGEDNALDKCPVVPKNIEELRRFADMLGWNLEFDNEGQAVLYTGMYKENVQEKEELE